jgi:hypothetical protein
MRRRDPNSWTVVSLPERDLADSILDLAAPLLERLGPASSVEAAHDALGLAISFWNASVSASPYWGDPRPKPLAELRQRMHGKKATPVDRAIFEQLTERWRQSFTLDPRLVDTWTYDADERGAPRLLCQMRLPDGVKAKVPPPIEKRISIGGTFLDEVHIRLDARSQLGFPVGCHRGAQGEGGAVTVEAMMPTALQLFAEGRLQRIGGKPVEIILGGRKLGPMVLAEVRCGGGLRHDIAELVFQPATPDGSDE